TRAQLEKQTGLSGKKAGKSFSDGVTSLVAQIPKKARAAADQAQKAVQKGALDSKMVLQSNAAEITKTNGKAAGKRFLETAKLEKDKQKLTQETSAATRRALRETTQAEERSRRDQARRWETAQREYMRHLQARERADRIAKREEARREEVALRSYQQ